MDLDAAINSPDYLTAPHAVNRCLREEDPVHWSEEWQGWMVSRYSDVKMILETPKVFSSASQVSRRLAHLLRNASEDARAQLMEFWGFQGLFQSDPPNYMRYRSQMIKALMPRLERIEPQVHQVASELLRGILEKGSRCEFVGEFSTPLPSTILFELLGIEPEERPTLLSWADTLTQTFADSSGQKALQSTETLREAYVWARRIAKERRNGGGDDIISLILASDAFGTMTERDILSTVVFLLTAGQGTLSSAIATCIYLLLTHPEQLEEVRANRELIPKAVEETLRYESPIQQLGRTVIEKVTIGGRRLKPGSMVFAMIGSANRDPAQFSDPDEFDIHRNASAHVAFGYGAHFCLGASLARLEARLAIDLTLDLAEELRLDGDIVWQPNTAFRTPIALPLAFGRVPAVRA